MTRDEAIEAGARALYERGEAMFSTPIPWDYQGGSELDANMHRASQDIARADAAAVLDAIGWAEPTSVLVPPETFEAMQDPTPDDAPKLRAMVERRSVGYLAAEPVGYVIAYDDRTPPEMVFQNVTDLPAALEWADPGERVWGLVPVEGAE